MQIFFSGSTKASEETFKTYLNLIDEIEKHGNTVWCGRVLDKSTGEKTTGFIEGQAEFESIMARIKYADAVYAEITECDPDVSYEISYALQNNIPVHCFYKAGADIPTHLAACSNIWIKLHVYGNERMLSETVAKSLENLSAELHKFVVVPITSQLGAYLDWISKKKKTSRSIFMRGLIEAKMKRDGEYRRGI